MRIGVLGLGFMGSTHLKALKGVRGAELIAVCSDEPKALTGDLSGVQGNIGGPGEQYDFSSIATYREPEDLLADPSVQAVDICLPTHMHADVAIEALKAGKHVLVEKPMALDAESAQRMIRQARASERILMSAQVVRFFPMYRALVRAVQSGELGAVRFATFRRRCAAPSWSKWLSDPELGGGGVFDLLIHDVDICIHLFGMPETVSATGYEALDRGIDLMHAELHYPGKGTVLVSGGWHHPKSFPFSMEFTVVSDGGTVQFDSCAHPDPVLYRQDGEPQPLPLERQDAYTAELQYFVDCCRENRQPDLCPPEESAAAVALMRLLLEARNRNGEYLACNLMSETSRSA